jgi:hypothetical protein
MPRSPDSLALRAETAQADRISFFSSSRRNAGDKSAFSAIVRYGGLIKSAFTVRRDDICGSLDFRILTEFARN